MTCAVTLPRTATEGEVDCVTCISQVLLWGMLLQWAFSLRSRRIGMRAAEALITSGRILPAAKLHEMGVVDVLAGDGEGEAAVRQWISKNQKRRNGFQAVFQARQHVHPIEREELDRIADVWVDAALRLDDRDLKMMSRIVRSQMRRMDGHASDAAQANIAVAG